MLVQGYPVELEKQPAADGGGFIATVPDLPGCMSDGETIDEALTNVADAIDCWLAAASRLGRPIPRPAAPALRA